MTEVSTSLPRRRLGGWSPRRIGENAASLTIGAGVIMLMQPLSLTLYGWSFAVILGGTVLFLIGSKLPR